MPYEFRADPKAKRLLPLQVEAPDIEAWMLAKDPTAIGAWNELGPEEYARAFTAARTAGTDIADDLYYALVDTFARSGTEAYFVSMVEPVLRQKGWLNGDQREIASRVRLIYDTNLRLARAAGRWTAYNRSADALPYLRAFTVGDFRVRRPPKSEADHTAWEGIILPITHWFWRQYWPPLGFNSIVPDQRVGGAAYAGLKAWYAGKVVKLRGRSGGSFTVTAQHPVLTARGWVDAKDVQIGDKLIAYRPDAVGRAGSAEMNENDLPPRIEDCFEALGSRVRATVPRAAVHLNGDVEFIEGNVDIVAADRALVDRALASAHQLLNQLKFMRSRQPLQGFASFCSGFSVDRLGARLGDVHARSGDFSFGSNGASLIVQYDPVSGQVFRDTLSADAVARGYDAQADTALEFFNRSIRDGFGPTPDLLSGSGARDKPACVRFGSFGHTPQAEVFLGGHMANANAHRDILDRQASLVQTDDVVDVVVSDYLGHVYDLQTASGTIALYGGDNSPHYVVSNCRCEVAQMTRSQFLRKGGRVTSEEELAQRIEQIGPPVFMAPGVPIERRIAAAVERTNADRIPGMPAIDPRATMREGEDAFDAVLRASSLRDITRQLVNMGF